MESYSLNSASVSLVTGYYLGARLSSKAADYSKLRIKPDFVIEKGGEEVTLTRST
jgi:hypothetical protein